MAIHCMIDLETLDTNPDCVILTIGAVLFNPDQTGILERLELKPTVEDQTEIYKRTISENTIKWWASQKNDVLDEALGEGDRKSLVECMEELYKFCWNKHAIWSNGASFDVVVCESAMRQTLTNYPNPIPWPYYAIRDTRTLYEIAGVKLTDKKYGTRTTHNAVEDGIHQAHVVQDAYKIIKSSGLLK